MKIDRLISIIMILNNREKVTAKELSEKFEVSTKTIQRDIETIEMAGIPIVSYKGHDGGYGIIESYKVNKASMTEGEMTLLKGLLDGIKESYKNKELLSLINKFDAIESKEKGQRDNFIVDLSRWGKSNELTDKINLLDNAINKSKYIEFNYSNLNGEHNKRKVEPYKIIFKALEWYLYAYCTLKNEMRIFKLTRMDNLEVLEEDFEFREVNIENLFKEQEVQLMEIIFKIKKEIKVLIEDNFMDYKIIGEEENNFIIKGSIVYNNWLIPMLLSFGSKIEILEPKSLRERLIEEVEKIKNLYKE